MHPVYQHVAIVAYHLNPCQQKEAQNAQRIKTITPQIYVGGLRG
ncbi:hypothetical protein VPHD81_0077 [Vibrio phage D81]